MPNAGSESWRFAHDIDQSLHCALYLRDAIGLEVDDRAGNPPRLVGDIPDRSQSLDREATTTAAARWPSWWRAVVGNQALTQLQSSSEQTDSRAWLGELASRHRLVVDPPERASLADSPALQMQPAPSGTKPANGSTPLGSRTFRHLAKTSSRGNRCASVPSARS